MQIKSQHVALMGLMLSLPAEVHAFYSSKGPVELLTTKNFQDKVLLSNYTSIVEFFAPWCGHCRNLQPVYESVAKNLKGIANIYAIDCDEEENKRFCGEQKVQGFPTIRRYTPNKGAPVGDGRKLPQIDEYQGDRGASSIRDFALETMPNLVTRLDSSKKFTEFLEKANDTAKVILFTNKGVTAPLFKGVAIAYKDNIKFAQVRDNQKEAVEEFGIEKYPTIVLLPGGKAEGKVYQGKLSAPTITEWITKEHGEPNKGWTGKPAQQAKKATKDKKDKTQEPLSKGDEGTINLSESITGFSDMASFESGCISSTKKAVCILVITPPLPPSLSALEAENTYLHSQGTKNFPFFQIARSALSKEARDVLAVDKEVGDEATDPEKPGKLVVRAISGHRGWYKKFSGDASNANQVRNWLDDLKMGEGKKFDFELKPSAATEEKKPEEKKEEEKPKEEVKEEKPKAPVHEEL